MTSVFYQNYALLSKIQQNYFVSLMNNSFISPQYKDIKKVATYYSNIIHNSHEENLEELHAILFPTFDYLESRVRVLHSKALQALITFIGMLKVKEDDTFAYNEMMELYRENDNLNLAQKLINKYTSKRNEVLLESINYHQDFILYSTFQNVEMQQERKVDTGFYDPLSHLDHYYLFHILNTLCSIYSSKMNTVESNDVKKKYESILSNILTEIDHLDPLLSLYYQTYLLMKNGEDTTFYLIKKMMDLHNHQIDQNEYRTIYLYVLNYCIGKLNRGDAAFAEELLELYKNGLSSRALYTGKFLSPFTYRNIALIGIRVQQYSWALEFLEDFKKDIPSKDREGHYIYLSSRVYFETNEYDKALDRLRMIKIADLLSKYNIRVLEILCFYAKKEFEFVGTLLNNFSKNLDQNRLTSYHKINYTSFVKYCTLLIKTKTTNYKIEEKIVAKLKAEKQIAEKTWLIKGFTT